MQCPNCSATLKTVDYEGIRIETCDSCHGEWLDSAELGHIVRAREVRFNEDERRAIAAATAITPVIPEDVDRDLKCPKCSGTTDALNYGGDTGIVIDRCTGCGGFWLDAQEMEKIQMVVEGWEDMLPEDLKKHGPRLRQIARELDQRRDIKVSCLGFVNAAINGILDIVL